MLGFTLTILIAIGFIFTIEIIDNTIKTPLISHKLTIIGIIPSIGDEVKYFDKLKSKNKVIRRLITRENPRPVSEAYRRKN